MYFEINWLEWGGALTGLAGAFILAKNKDSMYGWYFFLTANIFIILFAVTDMHMGLLFQQIGFTATSIYAIIKRKTTPEIKADLMEYYATIPCETHCASHENFSKCNACNTAYKLSKNEAS